MLKQYKTIYQITSAEIIEKKSRFIATIYPIETEEDALSIIEQTKKTHWNATHNCYAYTLGIHDELVRSSDDGEPNGTAGKPMLDVLLGETIHNTLAIVTRYFGGTLLGTGGLIRAYQGAVKSALSDAIIIHKIPCIQASITTNYNDFGKLQYTTSQLDILIQDTLYTDTVEVTLLIPQDMFSDFETKWTTLTNGTGHVIPLESMYYAKFGKDVLLFEH